MTNRYRLAVLLTGALLLLFALAIGVSAQFGSDSVPAGQVSPAGSDSNPSGPPEIVIPDRYRPQSDAPTLVAGTTDLYFTPQDEDTSTTVIFLYNTGSANQTAVLETFDTDGSPEVLPTPINVPAGELVRICADTVSTVSATWQDPVFINFRTWSAYAHLSLPDGVKAEAYVTWNNGATYDPLADQNTLPLRFSSDPLAIYLPGAYNDD